uniref:hypothetical protein n=1 Tax=Paenibacillus sp. 1-18 TaxID=1333846 RepID=UPI001E413F21
HRNCRTWLDNPSNIYSDIGLTITTGKRMGGMKLLDHFFLASRRKDIWKSVGPNRVAKQP